MGSQAVTLRICSELERNDSEALRNVVTCQVVLHNRVVEVRRNLPELADAVAGFIGDTADVERGQTRALKSNQTSKDGIESGDKKDK